MKLCFTQGGWRDYQHWVDTDRAVLAKVNNLIEDVRRRPFAGVGKPEPLRGDLAGWWSRRVTGEHRLVYRVQPKAVDQRIHIAACRYRHGGG